MSISVKTQRKRFKALSTILKDGGDLTEEQKSYFAQCFEKIGDGADANVALGLKYTRGSSLTDENARIKLKLIFSWISGATEINERCLNSPESALTVADALNKAAEIFDYNYDALRRAWYNKKYAHLKGNSLNPLDIDSPTDL
jgi:hypothetical protein